jgi:hypothetical protein
MRGEGGGRRGERGEGGRWGDGGRDEERYVYDAMAKWCVGRGVGLLTKNAAVNTGISHSQLILMPVVYLQ